MVGNATKDRPNKYLAFIVWLLPSSQLKLWFLRRMGNQIGNGVLLGPTLVMNCGRFVIGDQVMIYRFNLFRNLAHVRLGDRALIGQFNQFTAAPEYQRFSRRAGLLSMAELSAFTNRHYVDCSGQVILRTHGVIGGMRTVVQTHELNLVNHEPTVGKVVIDENAISSTGCVLLKDSYLPPKSVLAAHSLLTSSTSDGKHKSGLYAGTPARFVRATDEFKWWTRWGTPVGAFDDSNLDPVD